MSYLLSSVPKTLISTHGLSVGLPEGQMGNSEVGHMTIGAGRSAISRFSKDIFGIRKWRLKEK